MKESPEKQKKENDYWQVVINMIDRGLEYGSLQA